MSLRLAILFSALLALSASYALAQKRPSGSTGSSYQTIGGYCADPMQPNFSNSQYATAFAEARRAMRKAKGSAERNSIQKLIDNMKECKKKQKPTFIVMHMNNCDEFWGEYAYFQKEARQYVADGLMTADQVTPIWRSTFREPAFNCAKEFISKCIDPNDRKAIDDAIIKLRIFSNFGFLYTSKNQSDVQSTLTMWDPRNITMKFCTPTDYACKGDPAACAARIKKVDEIMQVYLNKSDDGR